MKKDTLKQSCTRPPSFLEERRPAWALACWAFIYYFVTLPRYGSTSEIHHTVAVRSYCPARSFGIVNACKIRNPCSSLTTVPTSTLLLLYLLSFSLSPESASIQACNNLFHTYTTQVSNALITHHITLYSSKINSLFLSYSRYQFDFWPLFREDLGMTTPSDKIFLLWGRGLWPF